MAVLGTHLKPYAGATPDPVAATREAMERAKEGAIPLVEVFYSLQGEGLRAGEATVFVRTAGCNCDCWFCDTDFRVREVQSASELVATVAETGGACRWVCLTGGEPTIQELGAFCDTIHANGYKIQVETNGSRPKPEWKIDHVTVSPKIRQGARLDDWFLKNATEFKHVIDDEEDLRHALDLASRHDRTVSLQPNALNSEAAEMCIKAVKANSSRLRLSLQTHKLLNIR